MTKGAINDNLIFQNKSSSMTNENTVKAKKGYDPETNTLDGLPFISQFIQGTSEPRDCSLCFYRGKKFPGRGDCRSDSAKKHFGYKDTDKLPVSVSIPVIGSQSSETKKVHLSHYCKRCTLRQS